MFGFFSSQLSHSQAHRPARALARLAVWAVLLALLAVASGSAGAQSSVANKAGLVVDFGGGDVRTACVDLGPDGQATGEELLAAAGFDVLMEYNSMGGAVCRIDAQGCNYPDQPCWCQCMSSPCIYWSYHHLANGQWMYSSLGGSSYVVQSGAVDGWAWGEGTLTQAVQPPVYTFDQLCAPPTATATPTPTATRFTVFFPTETWTPTPTATWTPNATATWTPQATATWTPPPTPTWTPDAALATTSTALPTPTPSWTATPLPAVAASLDLPATPQATPAAIAAANPPDPAGAVQPSTASQPAPAPPEDSQAAVFLPLLSRDLSTGQPSPVAVAQAAPADTPSPTPSPTPALVARGAVSGGGQAQAAAASPPRLERPANDPAAWRVDAALTTVRPDLAPPLVLAVLLSIVLAVARGARRGALHPARVYAGLTALGQRLAAATSANNPGRTRPSGQPTGRPGFLSLAIYGLTAGIGLLALLHPFIQAAIAPAGGASPASTPVMMTALVALCFVALLFEVQGQAVSAKTIALLGVLVAINAVLRFVEVSIPGPGGFTPIFFLIVLTGYVFGARFGFLMGALTLLVSALITGGVGPWLPGQMFTAGWMGLLAPAARPLVRLAARAGGARQPAGSRAELVVLAIWAGLSGLFYGVVINLWFWPFMIGPAEQYWQAGVTLGETAQRYAAYYLATSLLWDVFAVAGNVLLVAVFGTATLRALRRFQQRFEFEVRPAAEPVAARDLPALQGFELPEGRPTLAPSAVFVHRSREST